MNTKQRMLAGVTALTLPAMFAGILVSQAAPSAQTQTFGFAHPAFQRVWERTDLPVAAHQANRSWYWGPAADSPGLIEANRESPGGFRLVQYFDKSRMELNDPSGNPNDPFYVTNGLLTVELVSGRQQVGTSTYITRTAACIAVTGDNGDVDAPTYQAMQQVTNTTLGDHTMADHMGQVVTATINHTGTVGSDPGMASMTGTKIAYYDSVTKHNIPQVFWDFLNSKGTVSVNGQMGTAQLSDPWFYASGRPISEAYWTKATIAGKATQVMVQLYERRALTYVPTNTPAFQVEMANIGQHYYGWRYLGQGTCAGATPQPTVQPTFAPTGTVVPGGTGTPGPGVTRTAAPSSTVNPSMTIVVPSATVVPATIVTGTPKVPSPPPTNVGTPLPIGTHPVPTTTAQPSLTIPPPVTQPVP